MMYQTKDDSVSAPDEAFTMALPRTGSWIEPCYNLKPGRFSLQAGMAMVHGSRLETPLWPGARDAGRRNRKQASAYGPQVKLGFTKFNSTSLAEGLDSSEAYVPAQTKRADVKPFSDTSHSSHICSKWHETTTRCVRSERSPAILKSWYRHPRFSFQIKTASVWRITELGTPPFYMR